MRSTGMKSEKKAILGGSFDPVHMGHINLFHNISIHTDIATLYVVPAFVSAFKTGRKTASFDDRMTMLMYAVMDYSDIYPEDDLNIVVSDFEGARGGVSYTSETVKHFFQETEDGGKVNFMIGSDLLPTLPLWHDWEYLRSHVRFWCFSRDGGSRIVPEGAEVVFVESPETDASSTKVRSGDFSMVSPQVLEYIEDAGLYRD